MRNSKRVLTLGLLALAVVMLFVSTRVWISLVLEEGAATTAELQIDGRTAATGVMPIALALLAVAITLTISGRLMRMVLGILTIALGFWVAVASFIEVGLSRQSLVEASASELARVTGLGAGNHLSIVTNATRSVWPTVSGITGALVVLIGVGVLIWGGSWRAGGRKYEAAGAPSPIAGTDRISDWDSLSGGNDPSLGGLPEPEDDERESPGTSSTDPPESR